MKKPPVCRICGKPVVNGNLYCSYACGQVPKAARVQLQDAGFVQDATAPNIWLKDGVAVTVESVNDIGLEAVLRQHGAVANAAK